MPTAGIVVIGDEILSGKFANVIPDELDDLADTVPRFSARFDHVFTSGGVGPTHDDVTIAGIAKGFGVGITRHPELEKRVRAYWGAKLEDANLRLADVPDGAELVFGKARPPAAIPNLYRTVSAKTPAVRVQAACGGR